MTSEEFFEELVYHTYFDPLPDSWRETELVAMASMNPHVKRSHRIKSGQLIPVKKPPYDPRRDVMTLHAALGAAVAAKKARERAGLPPLDPPKPLRLEPGI